MANQLYPILPRVVDTNIDASPGAKLTFYTSGTTAPLTTYTTEACDVAHPSPLIAAADGSVPAIWILSGAAKVVVTSATDATMFTIDPVVATAGAGLTASDIPFSPTVALPFTNTQAAIEGSVAAAATGFGAFGLGISGNAALLAAIDAANIGAGAYRFDGTTTGTYPTGVAAADGGIIEHWRQASGAAMQMLYHATSDRIFHRRMAASIWGTWRENITTNQGAGVGDILSRGASAWTRLPISADGTVLGKAAGVPAWVLAGGSIFYRNNAVFAGANVATVQDIFDLNPTLDAGTVYEFEHFFSLSKSAGTTSHTISVGFGGTATINNIQRNLISGSAVSPFTTAAAPDTQGYRPSAALAAVTPSITTAAVNFWYREVGTISINTAGTLIPQYQLSAAPGGAYSTNIGGYFKLTRLGAAGADVSSGTWT